MRGVRELHITLELEPGTDPIRGNVRGETATRGFTGWMQLITALQAAVQEAQGAHPSTSPNHTED